MHRRTSIEVACELRKLSYEQHRRAIDEHTHATLLARQQRATNELRARYWLARLDPQSSEAMWFAAFASAYASRLEAAMAYVLALDEVDGR